jgi:hypothetical protein
MWYEDDHAAGRLVGPMPLPAADAGPLDERVRLLTQRIADELATGIAAHPQDWHMLQRMWLDGAGEPDVPGEADTRAGTPEQAVPVAGTVPPPAGV